MSFIVFLARPIVKKFSKLLGKTVDKAVGILYSERMNVAGAIEMQAQTDSLPLQDHLISLERPGGIEPPPHSPVLNRSALFSTFNALKALDTVENKRLNRALGLAQRKPAAPKYVTSTTRCSCPDHTYRKVVCKHIAAEILKAVAS